MSQHVLKPVIVGIFVLVILVAAMAMTYSTSPQASELTPSESEVVADEVPVYMAPYPGMAECSDGQDNDGDGLVDDTENSDAADPDCSGARDRSERYIGTQ